MEEDTKKGLVILGLSLTSLILMSLGFYLKRIPLVISIVLAAFAYIIHFDEKRKGQISPFGSVGIIIAFISGLISLLLLINSFA